MDFNVFDYSLEEQLGLFLGMFIKLGLVDMESCEDELEVLDFRLEINTKIQRVDSRLQKVSPKALQTLFEFAATIYKNYFDNPYHSFYHAIDVTYIVYFFMEDMSMGEQLDLTKSEKAILLIAALGHDVLHPGTNNLYQMNARTPVALKYNNHSVLEHQSADFVLELLDTLSLLESLSLEIPITTDSKKVMMNRIKECILKTDMTHHFSMLEKLCDIVEHASTASTAASNNSSAVGSASVPYPLSLALSPSSPRSPKPPKFDLIKGHGMIPLSSSLSFNSMQSLMKLVLSPAQKETMIQMMLHAADISNPLRPFHCCKKWSDLVMQEFKAQGLLEVKNALPLSPNMDPTELHQDQVQLTFTQVIVQPLFEHCLELFPKTLSLMDLILDNIRQWGGYVPPPRKRQSEDIKRKKQSLSSVPKRNSENTRRVSLAAGIIEIPESRFKSKQRNSLRNVEVGRGSVDLDEDIEEEDDRD